MIFMTISYSTVLLFGPPGSGKGTLGEMLAMGGDHIHVSSGDVFRSLDPNTKEGQVFTSFAGKGKLVPDEVTIDIFRAHIKGLVDKGLYDPERQLLLLDGLPRTKKQAEVLDQIVSVKRVILLDVLNRDLLIQRIAGRAAEQGRGDDQCQAVLAHRFEVYESQTKEVLAHYPESIVSHFNAEQSKLAVLKDVLNQLLSIF